MYKLFILLFSIISLIIIGSYSEENYQFKTCNKAKDCTYSHEVCLKYGITSFCAIDCSVMGPPCDPPFRCRDVKDINGVMRLLCVPPC